MYVLLEKKIGIGQRRENSDVIIEENKLTHIPSSKCLNKKDAYHNFIHITTAILRIIAVVLAVFLTISENAGRKIYTCLDIVKNVSTMKYNVTVVVEWIAD